MEVTITGRHLEITPAIRDYADKKVAKLTKYYNRLVSVDVLAVKAEKNQHEVELKVGADRNEPFIAKVHGQDLYGCIDLAVDKIERQLTDHKNKVRQHKGQTPTYG